MADILLTTLNARYFHAAALGLRYLVANLGELESETKIIEFILQHKPADIVETLLAENLGSSASASTSGTCKRSPKWSRC